MLKIQKHNIVISTIAWAMTINVCPINAQESLSPIHSLVITDPLQVTFMLAPSSFEFEPLEIETPVNDLITPPGNLENFLFPGIRVVANPFFSPNDPVLTQQDLVFFNFCQRADRGACDEAGPVGRGIAENQLFAVVLDPDPSRDVGYRLWNVPGNFGGVGGGAYFDTFQPSDPPGWYVALLLRQETLAGFGAAASPSPFAPPLPLAVSFSVDRDAEGIRTTVTDPLDPLQVVPPPPPSNPNAPNDVFALGTATGGRGYETKGEIFQSSGEDLGQPPDGTNVDRLSSALGLSPEPSGPPFRGPFNPSEGTVTGGSDPFPEPPGSAVGTFGLIPGDNIISLSYGKDSGNILQFSVDPNAVGQIETAVYGQALGNEAAGDIFKSQLFGDFGAYIRPHVARGHVLTPAILGNDPYRDQQELGLQGPAPGEIPPFEDDLDAFEEADTGDSFWGADIDVDGIVDPDKFAFFSLDDDSPSIGRATLPFGGSVPLFTPSLDPSVSPDDILVSTDPAIFDGDFGFGIYASGLLDIGLQEGDVLDALALSDVTRLSSGRIIRRPNGMLDKGFDTALFSLRIGSPSLEGFFEPGDVLFTDFTGGFGIYARYDQLGLLANDELNALDIKPIIPIGTSVPESTSTLSFLALGTLGAASTLKRKLKQSKSTEKETTKVS